MIQSSDLGANLRIYIFDDGEKKYKGLISPLEKLDINITVKEADMDFSRLAIEILDSLGRNVSGKGDLAIVMAKDPIGASMFLNKHDGIRAAACTSENDIAAAKRHNANVILLGDAANIPAASFASALVAANSAEHLQVQKHEAFHPESKQQRQRAQEGETVHDYALQEPAYAKKSLIKKVKDSLGIEE
jgi:ribose 5-phosphate isomerase RpiB